MAWACPLGDSEYWILCVKGIYLSLAGGNLKGLRGGSQ